MFATRENLQARAGLTRELAQVATPEDRSPIPENMLRIAIAGEDLSGFEPDDQTTCNYVLDAIDNSLADATELIGAYGIKTPALGGKTGSNLIRICCDLALYFLYRLRLTDEIEQRYNHAISLLNQHAKGLINLLPPVDTDGDGDVDADDDQSSVAGGVIIQKSRPSRFSGIYPPVQFADDD